MRSYVAIVILIGIGTPQALRAQDLKRSIDRIEVRRPNEPPAERTRHGWAVWIDPNPELPQLPERCRFDAALHLITALHVVTSWSDGTTDAPALVTVGGRTAGRVQLCLIDQKRDLAVLAVRMQGGIPPVRLHLGDPAAPGELNLIEPATSGAGQQLTLLPPKTRDSYGATAATYCPGSSCFTRPDRTDRVEWGTFFREDFDAVYYDLGSPSAVGGPPPETLRAKGRSGLPLIRSTSDGVGALFAVTIAHANAFDVKGYLASVIVRNELVPPADDRWLPPDNVVPAKRQAMVYDATRVLAAAYLDGLQSECGMDLARALENAETVSLAWAEEGMNEELGPATDGSIQTVMSAVRSRIAAACPEVDALDARLSAYLLLLDAEREAGAYRTLWSLTGAAIDPAYFHYEQSRPVAVRALNAYCADLRQVGWTSFPDLGFTVSPTGARLTCDLLTHTPQGQRRPALAGLLVFCDRPARLTTACEIMRGVRSAGFGRGTDPCLPDDPRRSVAEALWSAYRQYIGIDEDVTWCERAGRMAEQFQSALSLAAQPRLWEIIDVFEWLAMEHEWSPRLRRTMAERLDLVFGPSAPPGSAASVSTLMTPAFRGVHPGDHGEIMARLILFAHVRAVERRRSASEAQAEFERVTGASGYESPAPIDSAVDARWTQLRREIVLAGESLTP